MEAVPMSDQTLTCIDCGEGFTFSEDEQQKFQSRGWGPPIRCLPCRLRKRQERECRQESSGSKGTAEAHPRQPPKMWKPKEKRKGGRSAPESRGKRRRKGRKFRW